MINKLKNGNVFSPNRSEFLAVLLFLKGVFAPDSFGLFEADYSKRVALTEYIEIPFLYMDFFSKSKEHPGFSFENNIEELSFSECAQYMMFYLRLVWRQGGNDTFCTMWKNGSIEKLVDRMLYQFDNCAID